MTNDRKACVRQARYEALRSTCLKKLSGTQRSSVASQLQNLFVFDATFRMLNEARRIEEVRATNGLAWRLTAAGYGTLLATGIRRLVDGDQRADSLTSIIARLVSNRELLTRLHYVQVGGDLYDWEPEKDKHVERILSARINETGEISCGRIDWMHSERKHRQFDRLCDGNVRAPSQVISLSVLNKLTAALECDAIIRVTKYTDKVIAHAEQLTDKIELPTYDDIDYSLKVISRVNNFISATIFYDSDRSQVVPMPHFDVAQHLDTPFALGSTLPSLRKFWDRYAAERDAWSSANSKFDEQFLLSKPASPGEPDDGEGLSR